MAECISADLGERIAQFAQELVGTPFRFQGRDVAMGLDCVGVVRHALSAVAGPGLPDFRYTLRGPGWSICERWAQSAGLYELGIGKAARPGDILCVAPGPGQHHLMVRVRQGYVHAHYRIGRVVFWPDYQDWPLKAHWRLSLLPELARGGGPSKTVEGCEAEGELSAIGHHSFLALRAAAPPSALRAATSPCLRHGEE